MQFVTTIVTTNFKISSAYLGNGLVALTVTPNSKGARDYFRIKGIDKKKAMQTEDQKAMDLIESLENGVLKLAAI